MPVASCGRVRFRRTGDDAVLPLAKGCIGGELSQVMLSLG